MFDVPLDEVAATLDREAPAVHQLAARARRHVRAARPRYPVAPAEGERIARAFFAASGSGDVGALRAMLARDVVLRADGDGKVSAFRNPIVGLDRVLRLFVGLHRKPGAAPPAMLGPLRIDGLPGYASLERGGVLQATALAIEDGRVAAILITRNPDKLRRVAGALAGAGPPAARH